MKKIFIAVPSMGGIVPDLVYRLLFWGRDPTVGHIYLPENIQPMDNMRNQVVREFLKTDCTHLFWVDSDVVPRQDALQRLLAHNLPAVTAVCFCVRPDEGGRLFPYPVTFRRDDFDLGLKIYSGKGLEKIDACGGGCLMVKREVYEEIGPRPYEFVYDRDGKMVLTCDFNVWAKTRFPLYCDYSVVCDHQRKCSIKGFQDLLAEVA